MPMRKLWRQHWAAWLTWAATTSIAGLSQAADESGGSWLNRIKARTVEIIVDMGDGSTDCASGYLIDHRRVLTAAHVIYPKLANHAAAVRYTIVTRTGQQLAIDAVDVDRWPESIDSRHIHMDVAVLELRRSMPGVSPENELAWVQPDELVEEPSAHVLSYHSGACAALKAGETDLAVKVAEPRLESFHDYQTRRAVLTGAESPGFSGSPLVSTRFRKVIGVYNAADSSLGYGRGYATLLDEEAIRARLEACLGDAIPVALLAPPQGILARLGGVAMMTTNGQFPRDALFGAELTAYGDVATSARRRVALGVGGGVMFLVGTRQRSYYGPGSGDSIVEREPERGFHAVGAEGGINVSFLRSGKLWPLATLGLRGLYRVGGDVSPRGLDEKRLLGGPLAKLGLVWSGAPVPLSFEVNGGYLWRANDRYEYTGLQPAVRVADGSSYEGGFVFGLNVGAGLRFPPGD